MTRTDFNDIIERNNRKLFSIAFRILNNRQEAEDVVQEVFIKLWMMKNRLEQYDDITALAVTMTKNGSIDLVRKIKNMHREDTGDGHSAGDPSPDPYEQVVRSENSEIIRTIIEGLPDELRSLVKMRDIEEIPYEEISGRKGINVNSLRVAISRARRIIKDKYIKYNDERRKA